jgi:hypothetical protein
MPKNTLMQHIDGVGAQQFSYFYLRDRQTYDFRHLYTSNISLKSSFLKQHQPWFDTDFPYAAIEDAELAYRLAQRGLQIIYDDDPVGYHYHYHTIWTFAVRQYRAGLMVCELVKKHPELASFFRVTKTKYLLALGLIPRFGNSSAQVGQVAAWLEDQVLHLTSVYEWRSHALLDELYSGVLEYFWRKGLIDGVFQQSPYRDNIRHAYAIYYLKNQLGNFLSQAERLNIPVTISQAKLAQKIAPVESSFVRRVMNFWQTTGYRLVKPWLYPETFPS